MDLSSVLGLVRRRVLMTALFRLVPELLDEDLTQASDQDVTILVDGNTCRVLERKWSQGKHLRLPPVEVRDVEGVLEGTVIKLY